jgi:DNA-directed RNA polymerase specialized sigma24 family protein
VTDTAPVRASLLTQALIVERYGVRLNTDQIADLLGITKPALDDQISAGTLKLKTYVDGGKWYADYPDAAAYFETLRATAS